jgi:hemoglobin
VAKLDLQAHLPVITDFWCNVLFGARLYRGDALARHRELDRQVPLTAELFDRWLLLWGRAVDEHFAGDRADHAKVAAARIAVSLRGGIARPVVELRELRNADRRDGGTDAVG